MRPATGAGAKLPREALRLKREAARVQSPLAKYAGSQLTCVVCGSAVGARSGGSPAAWAAHLGSRAHKANVEAIKQKQQQQISRKREATPPPESAPAAKKLKSILKNGARPQPEAPPSAEVAPTSAAAPVSQLPSEAEAAAVDPKAPAEDDESAPIPEGFFDDPVMDAKARNIQYKNPFEEEWDKFQKEMKEQTDLSAAIIAGEQEEATNERQIEEIEEQMRNLNKVIELNRKKEEAAKQKANEETDPSERMEASSDEDEDFEEYLDWRAKKSYR